MKKVLFVLIAPLLLTACGGSKKSDSTPEDFKQSYTVDASKKGKKISGQEAGNIAKEIERKMNERTTESEQFIEDSKVFSYSFKNVIDDKIYLGSEVNYSSEEDFFSQRLEVMSEEDESRVHHISTQYEYSIGEEVVFADVNPDGSGHYYTYSKEGYEYNGIFQFLSEMMLECGNQIKNLLTQMTTYGDMPAGSGVNVEYSSSGAGNLYMKMQIPSAGITLEALCEDYWLTYEYMYTDMTQLMKNLPAEYRDLMEFQRMVTEIHFDFQHATVERPDLSNLRHLN